MPTFCAKSDYLTDALLNYVLRGTAFTPAPTLYAALYTTEQNSANTATECTDVNYARQQITFSSANDGVTTNPLNVLWSAFAAPQTIAAIGVTDALSGGNLYYFGNLTAPVAFSIGQAPKIPFTIGTVVSECETSYGPAPSGLTATAISSSEIDLAWTDNSTDEDGFQIERSVDGVNFIEIDTAAADATTYNDTGAGAGTEYWYRVRAFKGTAESNYTNIANATTSGGGGGSSVFTGAKVSNVSTSPQTINNNTNTQVTTTFDTVDYDTGVADYGTAYWDSANHQFVIPTGGAGKFLIECSGQFDHFDGTGQMEIIVNSAQQDFDAITMTAGWYNTLHCEVTMNLSAGDTVQIKVLQVTGSNIQFGAVDSVCFFSIGRWDKPA